MLIRSLKEKRERNSSQQSTHQQANKMRRYFAPASTLPPPGSTRGATGNRNVTQTSGNSPNTTPTDNQIIQLIPTGTPGTGATANYKFGTAFNNPPTVTVTALTFYKDGGGNIVAQELVAQGKGSNVGSIIHSTADDDDRLVFVHAVGNPN